MKTVQQEDAVIIIADIVKPKYDMRNGRNSIRGIIKRAIENGYLSETKKGSLEFKYDDFWRWAVGRWEQLQGHDNIPDLGKIHSGSSTINCTSSISVNELVIPSPDRLLDEYIRIYQENRKLRKGISLLEEEIVPLRRLNEKDITKREKISREARKPRGPRTIKT